VLLKLALNVLGRVIAAFDELGERFYPAACGTCPAGEILLGLELERSFRAPKCTASAGAFNLWLASNCTTTFGEPCVDFLQIRR